MLPIRKCFLRWDLPSLGLAFLAFFLGLLLISPSLGDMGGDSAQYLSLGRALAEGMGYRDTHLPGTPLHVHYPPGFPLLLAGEWLLFGGGSYLPFKLLVLLMSSLGLYAMGLALLDRFGRGLSLGALGMVLGLTPFLLQSVRIQSEGPYLFFLALFLVLGKKEEEKKGFDRVPWMALFCVAFLGFLMRMGGVVLFLALGFQGIRAWRRTGRKQALAWGLAGAIPVFTWILIAETSGGGTWSYGKEWAALHGGRISELIHSGIFYLQAIGASIGGSPWVAAHPSLMLGFSLVVFFGWGMGVRATGWRLMDSVLVFSLLLAILAPMRSLRYLIPIFPLLAAHFLKGLSSILSIFPFFRDPLLREKGVGYCSLGLALFHFYASTDLFQDRWKERDVLPNQAAILGLEKVKMNHWEEGLLLRGPRAAAVREAYGDFLLALQALRRKKLMPQPSLLAARKPRLVAWLSGIPCVSLPAFRPDGEWVNELRRRGVSHVIEDGLYRQSQTLFRRLRSEKGGLGLPILLQIRRTKIWGCNVSPEAPKGG